MQDSQMMLLTEWAGLQIYQVWLAGADQRSQTVYGNSSGLVAIALSMCDYVIRISPTSSCGGSYVFGAGLTNHQAGFCRPLPYK